jgi:hypothetical protein
VTKPTSGQTVTIIVVGTSNQQQAVIREFIHAANVA